MLAEVNIDSAVDLTPTDGSAPAPPRVLPSPSIRSKQRDPNLHKKGTSYIYTRDSILRAPFSQYGQSPY